MKLLKTLAFLSSFITISFFNATFVKATEIPTIEEFFSANMELRSVDYYFSKENKTENAYWLHSFIFGS